MLTAERVEFELKRFEPVLGDLGVKNPVRRARELVAGEKNWSDADVQKRWQSRINYWQQVLCDEGNGSLDRILKLDHPRLAQYKHAFVSDKGIDAWASYMRQRRLLQHELRASWELRKLLESKLSWPIYSTDGSFATAAAEEILNGRIRMWNLEPVQAKPCEDYDYLVQHPGDKLFQIANQCSHHMGILSLAYLEEPAQKWAQEWVREVMSHIDQCPALPFGHNDYSTDHDIARRRRVNVAWASHSYVSQRLIRLITGYVVMKDSPAFSDRFHGILLRMIHYHARYLHDLGDAAYKGNFFSGTAKSLYCTAAFFPELRQGDTWVEQMWPRFRAGINREILSDGSHHHRAFGYHVVFLVRPLAMAAIQSRLPESRAIPADILATTEKTVDVLVKVATPIRSTPGINDDVIGFDSLHWLLKEAAGTFKRDDWLYLATDGKDGSRPTGRSFLLPGAQVTVMRSDWGSKAIYGFFNISPDSGHHHPDTLSMQVWAADHPLLIDPGVGHYYTGEKAISMRSWWHNCPTFGKQNMPSRVKPRVLHWETTEDRDYAVGHIEVSGTTIRRHVFFVDGWYFVIWDEFQNLPAEQQLWENFHFGVAPPQLNVSKDDMAAFSSANSGPNLLLQPTSRGWTVSRENGLQWRKYGGKPVETSIVHYQADASTAASGFGAILVPFQGPKPPRTAFNKGEPRPDGTVELTVTVDGKTSELTTRSFAQKR